MTCYSAFGMSLSSVNSLLILRTPSGPRVSVLQSTLYLRTPRYYVFPGVSAILKGSCLRFCLRPSIPSSEMLPRDFFRFVFWMKMKRLRCFLNPNKVHAKSKIIPERRGLGTVRGRWFGSMIMIMLV